MNISEMKTKRKIIKEWTYQPRALEKGYANRTLYVNVGDQTMKEKPVSEQMKDKFVGGKGFGLRLLWDATKDKTQWNDPENEIVIAPGPCSGITQYSGAGKSLVVSISTLTDVVIDSNVGGYYGPFLKFSGWDAIEVQGKAKNECIVFVDGPANKITIEELPGLDKDSHILAEQLTEIYANDEKDRVNISAVSAGSAADHSLIGMLNFSFWDPRRKVARLKQAGRGGIGTVFRDKNIRALVCRGTGIKPNANNVADMATIMECGKRFNREMKELDDKQ
jgi:aldehyde:ferredoxin oxidoreductase